MSDKPSVPSAARDEQLIFRSAVASDLAALVGLLAADSLGQTRQDSFDAAPEAYTAALKAIADDPNNDLVVATHGGEIAGVMQLTFIPGLTYTGRWRLQIEGVRIAAAMRGRGFGQLLIQHAIDRARDRNACLVQLTSDKRRDDALRFYEQLGFKASHNGLKLWL